MSEFFKNAIAIKGDFLPATLETIYMVFFTSIFAGIVGLALGIVLVTTKEGGILENKVLNSILDKFINLLRAVPFIIILAVVAPLTSAIVGTRIGATAAIVPLFFGAFPFYAKQVESALSSIDKGLIEAAGSMGDSPFNVITRVYLREGLQNLVRVSALTMISLIGLSAMAGAIGAQDLGKLAIATGYNRFQDDVVIVSMVLILILVYFVQGISNLAIKKLER